VASGLTQLRSDLPRQFRDEQTFVPKRLPNELLQDEILIVKKRNALSIPPLQFREEARHVSPKVPFLFGGLHDRCKRFDKLFQTI